MYRSQEFTLKGKKYRISEDYAEDGTANTWLHKWNKSKMRWDWVSCSNTPYEEALDKYL